MSLHYGDLQVVSMLCRRAWKLTGSRRTAATFWRLLWTFSKRWQYSLIKSYRI